MECNSQAAAWFGVDAGNGRWAALETSLRHGQRSSECYTLPRTIKRMPLFDENGERIRGRHNQSAALQALAKVRVTLADEGHAGEGCDAYCYTIEQVSSMVIYCIDNGLGWLADVLIGLACTGLRINELASLRWSDLDQKAGMLRLTDERWSHRRIKLGSARHTKGKRTRCLPIHPDLMKVLILLPKTVDGLIFHGPLGAKLQDSTVL